MVQVRGLCCLRYLTTLQSSQRPVLKRGPNTGLRLTTETMSFESRRMESLAGGRHPPPKKGWGSDGLGTCASGAWTRGCRGCDTRAKGAGAWVNNNTAHAHRDRTLSVGLCLGLSGVAGPSSHWTTGCSGFVRPSALCRGRAHRAVEFQIAFHPFGGFWCVQTSGAQPVAPGVWSMTAPAADTLIAPLEHGPHRDQGLSGGRTDSASRNAHWPRGILNGPEKPSVGL
jgi:hypothetical protein